MSDNIYKFPDRTEIEKEAAAWLAKLDSDIPPTEKELVELTEWLNRSPAHRAELNNLNAFWSDNSLTALMVPIAKHGQKSQINEQLLRPAFSWQKKLTFSCAVSLIVAFLFLFNLLSPGDPYRTINTNYQTEVGEQNILTLPDGSSIHLNTNSLVEVAYTDERRVIRLLRGEAHFDVAQMLDRPFHVYANGGLVQAVGTAFSVRLLDGNLVDVLVTEGSVALASVDNTTIGEGAYKAIHDRVAPSAPGLGVSSQIPQRVEILKAGQGIIYDTERSLKVAESDSNGLGNIKAITLEEQARRQAWREGILKFSGDPLWRVVNEVSRYTTEKIEILDPDLSKMEVGGRMVIGDITMLLEILETNFGIQVKRINATHVQLSLAEE